MTTTDNEGTVWSIIEAKAKELAKGGKMTVAEATYQVVKDEPKLYAKYVQEGQPSRRTTRKKQQGSPRVGVRRARASLIEEAVAHDHLLPRRLKDAVHDLVIARLRVISEDADDAEARRRDDVARTEVDREPTT